MCDFLSMVSDGQGRVFYFTFDEREKLRKEGNKDNLRFDSHASICEYFNLDEDEVNKWEVDIFKDFKIIEDMINIKDDYIHVERYVKNYLIDDFGGMEKLHLEAVKNSSYALYYVKNQTEEICLEAVKNGNALKYVKNQTEELCLEAVKQSGLALQFVENQTEEICLEAVKQDGHILQFVKNQTEKICLEAVRENGFALQYVENQTEEICLEAVKRSGYALQYVKNQTEEMCLEAVKQNGRALKYVENSFKHLFI